MLTTMLWNKKKSSKQQTNKQETIECIQLLPLWKIGHEYMTGNPENSQPIDI